MSETVQWLTTLFSTSSKTTFNALKTKPSYSLLLTKQQTFTSWNRQNTTTYQNKTSQSPTKRRILIPYETSIQKKKIATKLGIDDRVDTTANKDAFITLKDHKPNFANKPTCRLINPTKSKIGKISK